MNARWQNVRKFVEGLKDLRLETLRPSELEALRTFGVKDPLLPAILQSCNSAMA